VRDGILVCQGKPMGYLYTGAKYENYKLVVEWRWAPGKKPGNSGVLLRVNAEPKPLPRCIEAQLQGGSAGDLYGFHGMKIDGDPARKFEAKGNPRTGDLTGVKKMAGNEKPPGEWNRYEITLDGPSLIVSVNGKKVNEARGCEVLAGPVALQSEGSEVQFRKVELTPLD